VQLNRAIAVAESGDVPSALSLVEKLDLDGYYLYHATVGDLMERVARHDEAADAYRRALEMTSNEMERKHLRELEANARLASGH
jgi:RNA polymerase sigma-70 factor (ECF subfamily)